jgi:hypothetical protein
MTTDRETWETERCERHELVCCGDCLEQSKMKRTKTGELRFQKDCAVETFAEIMDCDYDFAAEVLREAGFRPGVGTYERDITAAFESVGCTVRTVTHLGPVGAVVYSMTGRRFFVTGRNGGKAHAWSVIDGQENRPYFPPYRYRVFEVSGF